MSARIQLAPEVPDLASLGASSPEDFLGDCSTLATGARAEPGVEPGGRASVRVPLPGTADAGGVRRELPRGIGTGWLRVHTWKSGPAELARGRLSEPRSSSPAARRWNLACHLLAHGVAAPRPLLLVEEGSALERTSLLVELELEGFRPLGEWLAAAHEPCERRRAVQALGAALARVLGAGVDLSRARGRGLVLADAATDGEDCAAQEIERLRQEGALLRERGLRRASLPGIGVAALDGARIVAPFDARKRLRQLSSLEGDLPEGARLRDHERLLVSLRALADAEGAREALRAGCPARAPRT